MRNCIRYVIHRLLLSGLIACLAGVDVGAEGLAASPPMGWNSWDAYGFTLDEQAFKANASVLARLKGFGWQYAVLDEGWYMGNPAGADRDTRDYRLDENGRLIPALNHFPSSAAGVGLGDLADWTHRHGLKIGIHIVRGIPRRAARDDLPIADSKFLMAAAADLADTCPWDDGNYGVLDNAAGQAYYDSLFKLYAAWKIDYVKVDCIANRPYRVSEIRQIASAIKRAGRPMVLSLSPGPTDVSHAEEVGRYAQTWRISNDVWDGWSFKHEKPGEDFPVGIISAFDSLVIWAPYAGSGHWPDADMLPFGTLAPHPGLGEARTSRLTHDEERTQFVLWAIARSPLILGSNLTRLDAFTRSLISNRKIIELNQGAWTTRPLGHPLGIDKSIRVWIASPSDERPGETIIAFFNLGPDSTSLRATWADLGLAPIRRTGLDLFTGKHFSADSAIELQVATHATSLIRLH